MKRTRLTCTIVVAAALLGALPSAQAAPQKPRHVAAGTSSCVARQRQALAAAVDNNPGFAIGMASMSPENQALVTSELNEMRTRCLPHPSWAPSSWYYIHN